MANPHTETKATPLKNRISTGLENMLFVDNVVAELAFMMVDSATIPFQAFTIDRSLDRMHRVNDVIKQFDAEQGYSLQQILQVLREGKIVGNGLSGVIHFYWLNLTGIEYEPDAELHFRKLPNGNYTPDYTHISGGGP